MNNFDAMNRQYPIPKMKEGTYPFARNIILTDKYTSVMNEPGAKHIDTIPGLTIGEIVTSSHIVYFSTDLTYSYIGYRKLSGEDTSYKNIIKSKYFNFQIDCPIEGIFYYNYKNELIVGWCDGIFENSNPPYLINLDNLPFKLDNEKELINKEDINKAKWFPSTKEPNIDITYRDGGIIPIESMHITMSYCLEDGTELFWFPADTMAYPKIGLDKIEYRLTTIDLTNLDTNFEFYKVGVVINNGGSSTGYKTDIIRIKNYEKESVILDTLSNLIEVSVESLVFNTLTVEKVNTMTLDNNQVFLGNYITVDSELDNIQKYVNLLNIGIRGVNITESNTRQDVPTNLKDKYNHPSLLPNEVYSFKIKAKRLDGTYTDSFHIPNNIIRGNTTVENSYLASVGLGDLFDKGYKEFQIINNSNLVEKLDMFNHIYECGTYLSKETYPDVEDYNSLDLGGEDLRGLNIRYHRMPDSRLISTALNQGKIVNVDDDFEGTYMLFPFIKNIDIIPLEIRNRYQSFTLEIVKRSKANSIINDTGVLIKHDIIFRAEEKGIRFPTLSASVGQFLSEDFVIEQNGIFGTSSFYSNLSVKKNITFSEGSIISAYGMFNLNNEYIKYYKNIDKNAVILYKDYMSKYYLPNTASTFFSQSFGVLKDYKYYEENRSTNSTRFAPNQCVFNINSITTEINHKDYTYYNPTNYVKSSIGDKFSTMTYEIPFVGLPTKTFSNDNFYVGAGLSINDQSSKYRALFFPPVESYGIFVDVININSGLYKLKDSDLITIGKIDSNKFIIGGDIFYNNRLEVLESVYERMEVSVDDRKASYLIRMPFVISKLPTTSNNSLVAARQDITFSDDTLIKFGNLNISTVRYAKYNINEEAALNILNTLDFKLNSNTIIEGDSSRLNDIVASTSIEDTRDKFINVFPFRISKSLTIQKESNTFRNIRVIKTDSYYDMPNDKGNIVAIRSSNNKLYIQQKYSLFVSEVNATMNTNSDETVYLGQSLFLDRPPIELLQNNNLGYIGCQSKFACKVFRDGLIIIDMLQGKIFIINDSIKEVSNQLMRSYYKDNLKINLQNARYNKLGLDAIDNPFIGIGFNVTFDNEYERIIFTKQEYILKDSVDITNYDFNGEVYIAKDNSHILEFNDTNYINNSETFSIATETLGTVSNHDYFPSSYNFTNNGLFYNKQDKTLLNTKVFSMNSHDIEVGNHDGKIVESYIDVPFNKRLDLSKLYQALYWVTEVVDKNNVYYQEETLSKILLYNYNQCSGLVDLDINRMTITRNAEGIWQFNEFRDLVKDVNLPIIHNDGSFNESNINNNKYYFNKSNFIGIFIVARLYFKNGTMNTTYLHNVNVKSIISKR